MSQLTLLSMTAFTIASFISSINHFLCLIDFDRLSAVFYQLGKWCIYSGFVMRLNHVYRKSNVGVRKTLLRIYHIIFTIFYCPLVIFGYTSMSHIQYTIAGTKVCKKSFDWIYLVWSLVIDTINTTLCLLAYIRPLMHILRSLESTWHYNGLDFKYPVIKVSILTAVGTFVTVLSHNTCI